MAFSDLEFCDTRGRSVIGRWLEDSKVTARDRGMLVQKMDMLALHGDDLVCGLLSGPVKSKKQPKTPKHIYKLVIHGSVMLRPLLCKGPLAENEFTFLLGAIETGDVLDRDVMEAEANRRIVIADPSRRERNGRYR